MRRGRARVCRVGDADLDILVQDRRGIGRIDRLEPARSGACRVYGGNKGAASPNLAFQGVGGHAEMMRDQRIPDIGYARALLLRLGLDGDIAFGVEAH